MTRAEEEEMILQEKTEEAVERSLRYADEHPMEMHFDEPKREKRGFLGLFGRRK